MPWTASPPRRADGGDVEPADLSDRYNTALSPQDEAAYQAWGKQHEGRNPALDTYDYDMRGFWQSRAPLAGNGHAGDTYKKPNHPTFSNQSQYHGVDGQTGGAWYGGQGAPWGFTPSNTNLKSLGAAGLERYFQQREPGNYLMLPQSHAGGGEISPLAQQQLDSFHGQSAEELQEHALRMKGSPQGQMAQRVLAQKRILGAPETSYQAPQDAGEGLPKPYAFGGTLQSSGGAHMPERAIGLAGSTPPTAGGFLHTAGPGRTDNLSINPRSNSYVLPADVVSGLGEGNSLAGAKAMDMALSTGPGGIALPKFGGHTGHRMGAPKPRAAGGSADAGHGTVPIIAAGGEYILSPEQVAALGGGDYKRGHAMLDAFVLLVRQATIKDMRKLKGPVKS